MISERNLVDIVEELLRRVEELGRKIERLEKRLGELEMYVDDTYGRLYDVESITELLGEKVEELEETVEDCRG